MNHMRNIGIFAHVDAGKTTLSEQLLMHSGAIRRAGSVDEGTAHTDNLPVEQRRGISVKATCVSLTWRDVSINLIDTPGHVDFSAEVERSLWALDAAVVVVCAVEGVQPHTETLFHALKEQSIPTLFFLNKTDREGADVPRVLAQIQRLLTPDAVLMADDDPVTEFVCAQDDDLLERYLSGEEFAPEFIRSRLAALTRTAAACPVYSGSALRDEGVIPLLDAMVDFLPPPQPANAKENGSKTLCGVVVASTQDRVLGRGVWVRLYAGDLENRAPVTLPAGVDPLTGEEKLVQRKITQIRRVDGSDAGSLTAGEIGVIYGLGDVKVGQVLGRTQVASISINGAVLRNGVPLLPLASCSANRAAQVFPTPGGPYMITCWGFFPQRAVSSARIPSFCPRTSSIRVGRVFSERGSVSAIAFSLLSSVPIIFAFCSMEVLLW